MNKSDKAKILIVDDERVNLRILKQMLSDQGYEIYEASDGRAALKKVRKISPDLMLLDIMMPGTDGFQVCEKLKAAPETRNIPVIFLSMKKELRDIVRGFGLGAADYVTKPFQKEELLARVNVHVRLRQAEKALRESIESLRRTHKAVRVAAGIDDIVARSPGMKNVLEKAAAYHKSPDIPVLIEGETGTGKEMVARMIHYGRGDVNLPFVALNASALVPGLFESELFGYASGTFTGGDPKGKQGKLAMAGGGTLFLDEIGELPPDLQPKLLRVLQERYYYRVGGSRRYYFRARVLCATNRNLQESVEQKSFRADLYYRVRTGYLHIPPLRERLEDIGPLAELFIKRIAVRRGSSPKKLSSAALKGLKSYSWPGNIRELENLIECACLTVRGDEITPDAIENQEMLPRDRNQMPEVALSALLSEISAAELPDGELNLENLTNLLIRKTMEKFEHNKTRAAQYLGLSRQALHRRLEKI